MDLVWVWIPYAAMVLSLFGHIWRYRRDRFGWTDAEMRLFRPRALRWGIVLFHVGAFAVIAGHAFGLLVPADVMQARGLSSENYHAVSVGFGTLFGSLALVGIGAFLWRRTRVPVVVGNTMPIDLITLAALLIVIALGMVSTVGVNLMTAEYDYRATVGVWLRSLLVLAPDSLIMRSAPLPYQLHAITAWLVILVWPFSRLVHVWYFPFWASRLLFARVTRGNAFSKQIV